MPYLTYFNILITFVIYSTYLTTSFTYSNKSTTFYHLLFFGNLLIIQLSTIFQQLNSYKVNYKKLSAILLATISTFGFVACDKENSDIPSPSITDIDGNELQITKIGSVWFSYDDEGKLESFGDSYCTYSIDGDSFTVTDEDDILETKIYMNGDGYISKIHSKICEEYSDDSYYEEEGDFNFSYNSNGQLSSFSADGSGSECDDEYLYTFKAKISCDYKYNNGNLTSMKLVYSNTMKLNDESESTSETEINEFTYGDQINVLGQLPFYVGYYLTPFEELGAYFSVIGLFGNGSNFLPTMLSQSFIEDGEEEGPYDYSYKFSLNDNGTIKTETFRNKNFSYQYGNASRSVEESDVRLSEIFKNQMKQLFRRK